MFLFNKSGRTIITKEGRYEPFKDYQVSENEAAFLKKMFPNDIKIQESEEPKKTVCKKGCNKPSNIPTEKVESEVKPEAKLDEFGLGIV